MAIRRSARIPRVPLLLELLEDRTLLTGKPVAAGLDFSALTVEPSAYHPSEILVRLRPDAPVLDGSELLAGTTLGSELPLVPGLRKVILSPGVSVEEALAAYRASPFVLSVEPNYRIQLRDTLPNDPRFGQLYGLHNTGQTGGTPDADIDAPAAWDVTTGSGRTIVAVIDTGVDYTHPDLAANMWVNADEIPNNGIDDDANGYIDDVHGYDFVNNDGDPMDDHGHGTHVAGTIGAVGNNGVGIAGVTWDVQIMALKFLDAFGGGYTDDAIRALNYAVANGATISNNSWGGGFGANGDALYVAIQNAARADHLFVAAAGNNSADNDVSDSFPANYDLDNIIAVAATDHTDQLAWFSNYGATSVDLAAPGVEILSTVPQTGQLGDPSGYALLSGTSMATPHVTGVAALVRDLHPDWSYAQVIEVILSTVDRIPALEGLTVTGGRLNAAAAVRGTPPPDTTGPRVTAHSPAGSVSGAVDHVRLTFSEGIVPDTFTTADIVSFTGPGGALAVEAVVPVAGANNRQFDVTFARQTALGDYTLVLGPDIRDAAGNPMDQNRNGITGETADRYTARFTLSDVLVFDSDDVPAPIYDYTWLISYLDITQDVTIGDLDVRINITHTYDGDLYIHLVSPAGDDILLSEFRGGAGNDFQDTIFDDEASTPIAAGTAPFTGRYRPEGSLAVLDGQNARGTWQLWIEDWGFYDEGWLTAWSLLIQPAGSGPEPNNPPDAVDDSASTPEDTPVTVAVLANDRDPDGDPLTVTAVSAQNGTAVINADNTVTFTPAANFFGTASFTYTISDGRGGSDSATATVRVAPVQDPPVAVDDSATAFRDTPLVFNGSAGNPLPPQANDWDPDGDAVALVSVGNASNGTVSLSGGTVTFTPAAGFVGTAGFDYTITDGQGNFDTGRVTITVRDVFYFSTTTGGTLTGSDGVSVRFTDADILRLTVDPNNTFQYSLAFNGRAVGLDQSSEDIDAFTFLPDGTLILSTVGAYSVPAYSGTLTGGGDDLLRYSPISGWDRYFDGSAFGLDNASNENIDAVAVLRDGRLLISTTGPASVPGISAADEDLLAFTPTYPGFPNAGGTWSLYFDGSDVGLASTGDAEDLDALFVRESATPGVLPTLYFSTRGDFAVPGLSGADEDVFAFRPTRLGATTQGTFGPGLTLDGSRYGLGNFDLDGIFLGVPPSSGPAGGRALLPGGSGGTAGDLPPAAPAFDIPALSVPTLAGMTGPAPTLPPPPEPPDVAAPAAFRGFATFVTDHVFAMLGLGSDSGLFSVLRKKRRGG
jgi:subtilisin family serine protease/subtilisin-like proprotein convertase family protein